MYCISSLKLMGEDKSELPIALIYIHNRHFIFLANH